MIESGDSGWPNNSWLLVEEVIDNRLRDQYGVTLHSFAIPDAAATIYSGYNSVVPHRFDYIIETYIRETLHENE
jgi:hypothetical protein